MFGAMQFFNQFNLKKSLVIAKMIQSIVFLLKLVFKAFVLVSLIPLI